ncbi:MAG: ATP-dependent Clp protease adaptor ClpS [Pseudomonadales bacterium]|nr:ATP-dependent Clp protease adaptor ClpS [Pseudomonadales bacterium]
MTDTQTLPKPKVDTDADAKSKRAPMWKVIFHNDNVTTTEFVTWVLMRFFGHDIDKAKKIMLEVHNTGQGLAGTYPQEVAELKKDQVTSTARTQKFPLVVTIEPDE